MKYCTIVLYCKIITVDDGHNRIKLKIRSKLYHNAKMSIYTRKMIISTSKDQIFFCHFYQ